MRRGRQRQERQALTGLGAEYNAITVQGKSVPALAAFFTFDPAAFPRAFDAYAE